MPRHYTITISTCEPKDAALCAAKCNYLKTTHDAIVGDSAPYCTAFSVRLKLHGPRRPEVGDDVLEGDFRLVPANRERGAGLGFAYRCVDCFRLTTLATSARDYDL